jgi:hypothetical protein
MAPKYTNLASYSHFIMTISPDIPPQTMFQLLTLRYIKEHFPSKYHRKHEWEYQVDHELKKVHYLEVWLNDNRTDNPMRVTLTPDDSETMFRVMSSMFPRATAGEQVNEIIPVQLCGQN